MAEPLLSVRGLTKRYASGGMWSPGGRRSFAALDGIDLDIFEGETLGIVGESGCGKSTLGRCLIRLIEPTEGTITYRGEQVNGLAGKELAALRRELQMVFQDPSEALDPRMRIEDLVREGLDVQDIGEPAERHGMVLAMLDRVGLSDAFAGRFPRELSGGQLQRVVIARALVMEPRLVVADEAVAALDVSVRSQVLNLLDDLRREMQLTFVFISHDLDVVRHLSTRIAVLYLGRVVEIGETEAMIAAPQHPYTSILLSSVPTLDEAEERDRVRMTGEVPSGFALPSGCRFRTRCPRAAALCATSDPALRETAPGQLAACHFPGPLE